MVLVGARFGARGVGAEDPVPARDGVSNDLDPARGGRCRREQRPSVGEGDPLDNRAAVGARLGAFVEADLVRRASAEPGGDAVRRSPPRSHDGWSRLQCAVHVHVEVAAVVAHHEVYRGRPREARDDLRARPLVAGGRRAADAVAVDARAVGERSADETEGRWARVVPRIDRGIRGCMRVQRDLRVCERVRRRVRAVLHVAGRVGGCSAIVRSACLPRFT